VTARNSLLPLTTRAHRARLQSAPFEFFPSLLGGELSELKITRPRRTTVPFNELPMFLTIPVELRQNRHSPPAPGVLVEAV